VITVTSTKSSGKTESFLEAMIRGDPFKDLARFADMGIKALAQATPVDSGETAHSWHARTGLAGNTYFIEWYNTHSDGGPPVAVLIQYGHGTGTGGYVAGRDYINPAMRPVFDKIVAEIWKQVKNG
jgi:hypothetical protein